MKRLTVLFITFFLLASSTVFSAENNRSLLEKILNRDLPGGSIAKEKKKVDSEINENNKAAIEKKVSNNCKHIDDKSLLEKILKRDLPGGNRKKDRCIKSSREAKIKTKNINNDTSNNDISIYSGTFDVIDKEGDDKTTLFGMEHKNPDLFRDTFLGKFSPITGGFMTGNSSIYLYTGIEGQYGIGPLKILPSFAPGYYEKGDGKDLGSILEFKSEIKLAFDIFSDSKIGYSYSHISNNDWGERNPGTDNQQITFSKNF